MDERIEIPDEVFADFETVRASGFVNMFMRGDVLTVAEAMGCEALVEWAEQFDRHGMRKAWPALLTRFGAWKEDQDVPS